ncbi:MAG TPA: C25 family cysteine peptidase [Thermoanaerobaculia bacterium]|nr:C25 family cysteine peptidase [Thermoanaerobaculia bacterium]
MAAPPTVNGLFYGDGDDARYQPYAVSENGSVLYAYFDVVTSRLFVALVDDQTNVNDMVCSPQNNGAYTQSVGWGNHRSCKRASDSEFASFTLECAPGSTANSWSWQQGFACATVAGPPQSGWVSNSSCTTSAGIWPPSIDTSSSWVANVTAYQANPTPAWNMYAHGTQVESWKSPFLAASPNDATLVPGYPTYSGGGYQWEWSMVYEWSVNLGPAGANCGNQPIYFISGVSHHSPAKNGDENDSFPPGDPPDLIFSDWGDLPDGYRTTDSAGGARHYLKVSGPYLGADVQAEPDGEPTNDATGDGNEEDGVELVVTGNWTPGSTQTIEVTVGNAPSGALLAAWFDWNDDGDVSDPGEFFSWNVSNGADQLDVVVGAGFDWQTDDLYARFRIFSNAANAPGGSLTQADFSGIATDGEVEDYTFTAGTLPVSLNAFASELSGDGSLTVRWQTASETDNVGFELWGRVRGEWRPIGELVPSQGSQSALPRSYEVRLDAPDGLSGLRLVDYDTRGRAEHHGAFRLGQTYGETQRVEPLDWSGPRAEQVASLAARGFAATDGADEDGRVRWRKLDRGGARRAAAASRDGGRTIAVAAPGKGNGKNGGGAGDDDGDGGTAPATETILYETGPLTHVAVTAAGVQRITYEALRDGGLDLAGVPSGDVAVTFRGEPVARWIDGPATFGPGSAIELVGRPPAGDEALYLDAALYQVSIDPSRVREARSVGRGSVKSTAASYRRAAFVDRAVTFNAQSPTGDPWIDRTVLVRRAATVTLDLPVEGPLAPGAARLIVGLGTITDLPDLIEDGRPVPEHNVEVWFAGPGGDFVPVASSSASGQRDWTIQATLPAGLAAPGTNRVQLRFSTDYFFSLVAIDRWGLELPVPFRGPTLDFAADPAAGGYRVEGFAGPAIAVYAEEAGGGLTRVEPRVAAAGGGWAAEIRAWNGAERYWVTERPHAPEVFTTEEPGDLLAGPAELVVIAGSSLIGTPALADYLAQTADFDPVVVDVEDVFNGFGFGMALPGAINDYLRARHAVHPFTHVQLVGTDCYDRLNKVSACLSLLPLPTAPVGPTIYSPSQNRLADLDGDGIADVAIAQFSVRGASELATIVAKGESWRASGLGAERSALLIAEESDGLHDFRGQIERLRGVLGWEGAEVLALADHPGIGTARAAFAQALAAGRALTVYSGHSSPTVWGFRGLLTAGSAATLPNAGRPTLMVPLACETTYDVSPSANVLGHQLLYGGDRGALAISGAVALSSLADNERMARHVLSGLEAGMTLGEAVQAGREALGREYLTLQDNWMTQGDVTVRLTR